MSEEVDLVIVHDHARSEEICQVLKQAGIHHVEFWPEDMLSDSIGLPGSGFMDPMFRTRARGPQGPFHIRVREEDLAAARLVLSSHGLQGG